jgi:hypothetical protein
MPGRRSQLQLAVGAGEGHAGGQPVVHAGAVGMEEDDVAGLGLVAGRSGVLAAAGAVSWAARAVVDRRSRSAARVAVVLIGGFPISGWPPG